ncbi:MAG TPA: hypothetical protein VNH64_11055 [Parvularculaceae bacterium]|nr:hypothetical protein [Parvularculaceae bacterium]
MPHLRSFAVLTLLTALGLPGCASNEVQRLADEPTYEVGYGDGCTTATEEAKSFSTKRARDEYLFKNDRAYRAGWRQGYLECTSHVPARNNGGRILGDQKPQ